MKKFNLISLLLVFMGVLSLTSCKHEHADWTPGSKDANMGVYFEDTSAITVTAEDTSAQIVLKRLNTAEAADVKVRFEDVNSVGFFTVEPSAKFEQGSDVAYLNVTFDGTQLVPGTYHPLRFQIDPEVASIYGASEAVISIGIKESWVSLGIGTYRDDFMGPLYGSASGYKLKVEVFQNELEPNRYRVFNPFTLETCSSIIGAVPDDMVFTDGEAYIEFVLFEDGSVEIPSSPCGFQLAVEESPVDFFLATVYSNDTPMRGQMRDNVFWFDTPNSIMWHIPDGRGNYANQEGLFALALPNGSINDFSISAAYGGLVVGADNQSASALVDFVLGNDVKSFRFTAIEGYVEDVNAVADEIVNNAEDTEYVVYEAKAAETTWKLNLDNGIYTLVMVPYDAAGNAVLAKTATYSFYFPGFEAELPDAEFEINIGSVADVTGNPDYEANYPAEYNVMYSIEGDPAEVVAVQRYFNYTFNIEPNATDAQLASMGTDISLDVLNQLGSRGYFLDQYTIESGADITLVVAITTIYGKTNYYRLNYVMPYTGVLDLGEYKFVEGEKSLNFTLIGGTEAGVANLLLTGFNGSAFTFDVDDAAKAMTCEGVIDDNAGKFNALMYYYDSSRTSAYGFWVSNAEDFQEVSDLVLTFDENGTLNGLNNHFACFLFNLESGEQEGTLFYFSPEATIVKDNGEEQPATPTALISRDMKRVNGTFTMVKAPIHAEVFTGGKVIREFKHNAILR